MFNLKNLSANHNWVMNLVEAGKLNHITDTKIKQTIDLFIHPETKTIPTELFETGFHIDAKEITFNRLLHILFEIPHNPVLDQIPIREKLLEYDHSGDINRLLMLDPNLVLVSVKLENFHPEVAITLGMLFK